MNRGYDGASVPAGNPLEPAIATAELRPCGAAWTSDFSDGYYECRAVCDLAANHAGQHAGAVVIADGPDEGMPEGVRLSWPTM